MRNNNHSNEIKINVNEEWEMEWWPYLLGISRKELLKAVKKVGPYLGEVKSFLLNHRRK